MAGEGVFPKAAGDVAYASEANIYHGNNFNTISHITVSNVTDGEAVLGHSATAWSAYEETGTAYTSNTGGTWTNGTISHSTGAMCLVDSNLTNGMICGNNGNHMSVSTNSGQSWTEFNSPWAGATNALCVSAPSTSVAVVGLDRGSATRSIFYSTNNGTDWTVCAAGPTADVCAIDMFSTTVGIAVDDAGNIWTTSNAGVNWTDSGQGSKVSPTRFDCYLIALTATTYIMVHNNNSNFIETGTTSAGGTERAYQGDMGGANMLVTNLVKTTNGNLYCVVGNYETSQVNTTLWRSKDSGLTWDVSTLPNVGMDGAPIVAWTMGGLSEIGTNKLILMAAEREVMVIDETGST